MDRGVFFVLVSETRRFNGTLALLNANALQNSTLDLDALSVPVSFDSSVTSKSFTLGGLEREAALSLQNNAATPAAITLNVGNNNDSTTYPGSLTGSGNLAKIGTGTLTLYGNNSIAGGGDDLVGKRTMFVDWRDFG